MAAAILSKIISTDAVEAVSEKMGAENVTQEEIRQAFIDGTMTFDRWSALPEHVKAAQARRDELERIYGEYYARIGEIKARHRAVQDFVWAAMFWIFVATVAIAVVTP